MYKTYINQQIITIFSAKYKEEMYVLYSKETRDRYESESSKRQYHEANIFWKFKHINQYILYTDG
jgi:hypothetical protein